MNKIPDDTKKRLCYVHLRTLFLLFLKNKYLVVTIIIHRFNCNSRKKKPGGLYV